jgi:hypothetical protein
MGGGKALLFTSKKKSKIKNTIKRIAKKEEL